MALYRYRYGVEAEQQANGLWRCVWPDGVTFKMSNVQFHEAFEEWDGPQPQFVDLEVGDGEVQEEARPVDGSREGAGG